jgi:CHASE3 domain sensor protein
VVRTFALVLIIALATGLFVLGVGNQVRDEEESVIALQSLRAEILAAQSSVRGFTIVGMPRFLEAYHQAVPAAREAIADADAAMEGHERRRLARMADIFGDWRREFAEPVIALVRQGRRDEALALERTERGKQRIDVLKALIADEIAEEREEIEKAQDLEKVLGSIAIAAIAALCLALALGGRLRRGQASADAPPRRGGAR